jgi:hypothetical protein
MMRTGWRSIEEPIDPTGAYRLRRGALAVQGSEFP